MQKKALVVIDIQNEITKNYKDIIDNINRAVEWAADSDVHVIYIRHENLSAGSKVLKPNTFGSELATDLKVVSENIFTKNKSNILTSEELTDFISRNEIGEFTVVGADATICVKSSCFNLRKAGYDVNVLSDCITSWSKKKIPEMIEYYESKGCNIMNLKEVLAD